MAKNQAAPCPPCPDPAPCPQVAREDYAVKPAASFILMPAAPSSFRSAVDKVPGLRWLQRSRYKAGERFRAARPVSSEPPEVPGTIADQATAVVVAEVGESGEVTKAKRRGGDELLGALAAAAMRHWRFEPATLGGTPVTSEIVVHFTFNAAPAHLSESE